MKKEKLTKQLIVKATLAVLFLVSGYFAWRSIFVAVMDDSASDIAVPAVLFSLTLIFVSILSIVIKRHEILFTLIAVFFISSMSFALHLWHVLIVLIAVGISIFGAWRIRQEIQERIHIDIVSSLRQGFSFFILATTLCISSVYFWTLSTLPATELFPRLELGKQTDRAIVKSLRVLSPEFRDIDEKNTTVDQFLKEVDFVETEDWFAKYLDFSRENEVSTDQEGENTGGFFDIFARDGSGEDGSNDSWVLQQKRKQLSDVTGTELKGDEEVSGVFATIIKNRMVNVVTPEDPMQKDTVRVLAIVLAVIIFIVVTSIATILKYLWLLVIFLIFILFKRLDLIRITKKFEEVERIE